MKGGGMRSCAVHARPPPPKVGEALVAVEEAVAPAAEAAVPAALAVDGGQDDGGREAQHVVVAVAAVVEQVPDHLRALGLLDRGELRVAVAQELVDRAPLPPPLGPVGRKRPRAGRAAAAARSPAPARTAGPSRWRPGGRAGRAPAPTCAAPAAWRTGRGGSPGGPRRRPRAWLTILGRRGRLWMLASGGGCRGMGAWGDRGGSGILNGFSAQGAPLRRAAVISPPLEL